MLLNMLIFQLWKLLRKKKGRNMIHVISEINSRLHKSDWSTQKTDSRKEVAYAPDDQEVSIVKVTLHA